MQAIDIKNLNFSCGKIKVFDGLNLSISEGDFTAVLGKNGSGKTMLANILSGNLKFDGEILVLNKQLDKKISRSKIGTVFSDLDDYDSFDIVMNMLVNSLTGLSKKEIQNRILNIASEFKFNDVLDKTFNYLSFQEKILVMLGLSLVKKPKILILDNIFEGFDKDLKNNILKKLKRFAKKEKMTVIDMTNDVEDTLLADNIVIIGDGKVLLSGSKRKVFEKEAFFEKNNMALPFVVSLSDKLKFYELIDKIYFDEKKLVDDLWK